MLLVAVVGFGLVRSVTFSLMDFPETFRAATECLPQEIEDTRALLEHWMRRRSDWCGLSAAHVRVYRHLLVLRLANPPRLQTIYNAHWRAATNRTRAIAPERPTVCHDQRARSVWRWDAVHVSGLLPLHGEVDDILLTGAEAHCAQRLINLLDGEWPCEGSLDPMDAMRIPAPLSDA